MPTSPRIVMFGTGDFALPTFEHLIETGHSVVALVTQPDRPQGRKQLLIPSPIKLAAQARGVTVEQPDKVNDVSSLDRVRAYNADLFVTAAYGQILSGGLLSIPPMGGINLHGSVLPAYRGAAPVARAIENGESETGVTVIRMTPKIDAGGMIAFSKTPIDPFETAEDLENRLARIGAPLVARCVADLVAGSAVILPQDKSKVTKAPKLRKEDGWIDWTRSNQQVHDLVRAMQPWPTVSTVWKRPSSPVRLIVHRTEPIEGQGQPGQVLEAEGSRLVVAAGKGAVRLLKVQLEGKKACEAVEFLRGHHPYGDFLGGRPDCSSR